MRSVHHSGRALSIVASRPAQKNHPIAANFSRFLSTPRESWASGTIVFGNLWCCPAPGRAQAVVGHLPRFYFHIVSDNSFIDDEGLTFDTERDAMDHARQLAAQLVSTTGIVKGAIVVENEDAGGMFEVPLTAWNS